MATARWKAITDSSWSGISNWDTSAVPTINDYVLFDNTSVKNCTVDIDVTCASITIASGYTGNITATGRAFSLYGFSDDGSGGSRDYGNRMTINCINAISYNTFHVGSSLGSITASSCNLVFAYYSGRLGQYYTTLDDDYGCTFRSFTVSTNTNISGAVPSHFRGDGTLFTYSYIGGSYANFIINTDIYLEPTSSGIPIASFSTNNTTSGSGKFRVVAQTSGTVISIPTLAGGNYGYSGGFHFTCAENVDATFLHTGTMSFSPYLLNYYGGGPELCVYTSANNSSIRYDTSSNTISMNRMAIGSSNVTSDFSASLRNSNISLFYYDGTTYDVGGTIDFNTSTIMNYPNAYYPNFWWSHSVNKTLNYGTFTFDSYRSTGLNNCAIFVISNKQSFYTFSSSGSFVTFYDDVTCLGSFGVQSFDIRNITLSAVGSASFYGTSYLGDSTISMDGTGKTLTIGTSTVPIGQGLLKINGPNNTINDSKGLTFNSLYIKSDATAIFSSSHNSLTIFSGSNPIQLDSRACLNNTSPLIFVLTTSSGDFIFPSTFTITGNSNISWVFDTTSQISKNISQNYRYIGIGTTSFLTYSDDATWNLSNDYTSSSGGLVFAADRTGYLTVNTNNYKIKANSFSVGCSNSSGRFVMNYGSSNVDVSAYNGSTYNSGSILQNLSSSIWSVGTYFAHGSNHIIDPGTSYIALSSGSTFITASKYFYDVSLTSVTMTGDLTCHNLNWNGNASWANYRIISSGNVLFNSSALYYFGNGITLTGSNSYLYIAGPPDNYSTNITFSGTGDATFQAAYTSSGTYYNNYGKLTIAPGLKLIHTTAAINKFYTSVGSCLDIGAGAVYTLNSSYNTAFQMNSGGYLFNFVDATWKGNGPILVTNNSSSAILLGYMNYIGTGSWTFACQSNTYDATYQQMTNLNFGSAGLTLSHQSGASVRKYLFDTGGYSVTCGNLVFENLYNINSNTALFKANGSIFNVTSFTGNAPSAANINIDLGTSQWYCDGSWTYGRLASLTMVTPVITFTNNGTIACTNTGLVAGSFYDVTCNAPNKTMVFSYDTTCHDLTLIDGSYSHSGKVLTVLGDARFNGYGSLNLGNGIVSNSNDATISIASTISGITSLNCPLTISGSNARLQMDKDATFRSLYIPSLGGVTVLGSNMLNLAYSSSPLTMNSFTTLTVGSPLNLQMNATGTPINILASPYTITGDSTISFDSTVASTITTVPNVVWGGNLNLAIRNNTPSVSNKFQLGSILNAPANFIINNTNTGTLTFSPLIYNMTVGSLSYGGSNPSGTLIVDYSSVTINVGDVNSILYNSGTNNIRFRNSNWNVSGDWVFPSSHNNTHGWDNATFTGGNNITCNGLPFNWVYFNAPSQTITMTDPFICREYKTISGSFAGYDLTATGYYVEIMISE